MRPLAFVLHGLLVAAFVPVLVMGLLRPDVAVALLFAAVAALAWLVMRLAAVPRWRMAGLLLAVLTCAGIWSMALLSVHLATQAGPLLVP